MNMVQGLADIKFKYPKKTLIDALEYYKKQHLEDFTKAVDVYKADILSKLKYYTKKYKREVQKLNGRFEVPWDLGLSAPVDVSKQYDQLILILNNTTDGEIELAAGQASSILNNDWLWSEAASVSNAVYSSRYKK